MIEQVPLVSIGMPAYNGAKTIERAIDSLLAQDFKNFELIIADDCSVDATPALCDRYARQDIRVHFSRNSSNLGARGNLYQLAQNARGRYFLYASQDDEWAPRFLSRLVGVLEEPPGAVAAMCVYGNIYPDGEDAGTIRIPPEDWPQRHGPLANAVAVTSKRGRSMRPLKTNIFIYGVIRTECFLDCLRSLPEIFINERQLVCLLALAGRLVQVDELLFTKQRARRSFSERWPDDPLVLKRRSAQFPSIDYVTSLGVAIMRSDIVPLRRKLYIVPISIALLWARVVLPNYACLLGAIKKALPERLFFALQRLRGRA